MDLTEKELDVRLDGIKEAIEDKRNEVEALEHRVRAAGEEYERTKEVCQLCFFFFLPFFQLSTYAWIAY